VKPDWIQCDCKGHAGYTSWPTAIGTPSPGIVKDALRIHRDVTRELGIKLGCTTRGLGQSGGGGVSRVGSGGGGRQPQPHMTCRRSAYDEVLMIPQMLELVHEYDVDGFWVDGENWASAPCWCERCRNEFRRRSGLDGVPMTAGSRTGSTGSPSTGICSPNT